MPPASLRCEISPHRLLWSEGCRLNHVSWLRCPELIPLLPGALLIVHVKGQIGTATSGRTQCHPGHYEEALCRNQACRAELVSRGAIAAVLRLLRRGLRSADAVSATPVGRQLHPEDLHTLLTLLQRLTADGAAGGTAGVRAPCIGSIH